MASMIDKLVIGAGIVAVIYLLMRAFQGSQLGICEMVSLMVVLICLIYFFFSQINNTTCPYSGPRRESFQPLLHDAHLPLRIHIPRI